MPDLEERVAGGKFLLKDGTEIGTHDGYPFYTVGQRKGLGVALGYPMYVTDIRKETNEVVLGPLDGLHKRKMVVKKLNMMKYEQLTGPTRALVKVRYADKGTMATIEQEQDVMTVVFDEPVFAIAPGQAAVFYEDGEVIGGGWIMKSMDA